MIKLRDIPLIAYIVAIAFGLIYLALPSKVYVKYNNKLYKPLEIKDHYATILLNNSVKTIKNPEVVYESKIKFGIDIVGGKRVILYVNGTKEDVDAVYTVLEARLNSLGISDVRIYKSGNYIIIELPTELEDKLKSILREGKFEAKIDNTTVYTGKDIIRVCLSPSCSGVDLKTCKPSKEGWVCQYRFAVWIDKDAAKRFALLTKNLSIVEKNGTVTLNKTIDFYLDNKLITKLNIDPSLKGKEATVFSITGFGVGETKIDAIKNAYGRMKYLQTILLSGSFPVKPEIVSEENIIPSAGQSFLKNVLQDLAIALIAVIAFILVRYALVYKDLIVSIIIAILMGIALLSEIFLIVVVASLINWVLDIASIAGILLTVGTGVDYLIISTDELLRHKKTGIKKALQFIVRAFVTTGLALIALAFAAASLMKGFALTTLIGLIIGAFITRPAYIRALERVLEFLNSHKKH
ncbi:NEQ436 [Nanoarchaeum equitans Kin4-M]|uniref:NEQ436 n=1 Tax=Nanoarchaeum equitans (strain Kin4-M) TaxID=228908 RepID=Q74M77_NANEQ|nr:NEQ436 [Nanoarchaeum equitans Kin4-M]